MSIADDVPPRGVDKAIEGPSENRRNLQIANEDAESTESTGVGDNTVAAEEVTAVAVVLAVGAVATVIWVTTLVIAAARWLP